MIIKKRSAPVAKQTFGWRLGGGFTGIIIVWMMMAYIGGCGWARPSTGVDMSMTAEPHLIAATLKGDVDSVGRLLAQGTDANVVYRTNTALTYAARDGQIGIARLLIDHGADVNWIDGEGVTPLILAAFKNYPDLVQLLLDHGADVTVRDQWDRTALDYALRRGEADAIAQLLQQSQPQSQLQ